MAKTKEELVKEVVDKIMEENPLGFMVYSEQGKLNTRKTLEKVAEQQFDKLKTKPNISNDSALISDEINSLQTRIDIAVENPDLTEFNELSDELLKKSTEKLMIEHFIKLSPPRRPLPTAQVKSSATSTPTRKRTDRIEPTFTSTSETPMQRERAETMAPEEEAPAPPKPRAASPKPLPQPSERKLASPVVSPKPSPTILRKVAPPPVNRETKPIFNPLPPVDRSTKPTAVAPTPPPRPLTQRNVSSITNVPSKTPPRSTDKIEKAASDLRTRKSEELERKTREVHEAVEAAKAREAAAATTANKNTGNTKKQPY